MKAHPWLIALSIMLMAGLAPCAHAEDASGYLGAVRAYADALIEQCRDTSGEIHSPLFASAMDRTSMALLQGEALEDVRNIKRESWGIRPHDRMLTGANPMHDENAYQVLYALTAATGEPRYAQAADDTLRWFFEHCQSPATGLMAWGEHIGWDFLGESIIEKDAGTTHEYFRPWVLWPKSFALAPEPCARFARGVWEHQIGDPATGNFSRHARYDKHGPGTNSEYPRHGGFYIATWAYAYGQTQDPVFLKAIDTLLSYFENRRNPGSGAIPAESAERSKGKLMWPPSNLSLAVDLYDGAAFVPDELAAKMRASATHIDDILLRIKHELGPRGQGFIKAADTGTLGAGDARNESLRTFTRMWATGYGDQTDAQMANLCFLRYQQVKRDEYKRLILDTAARYLDSEPDIDFPVYPGTLGDVIYLMLNASALSGGPEYLVRAHHFARKGLDMFLTGGCPLPKASTQTDHYEAITRADTLMMALLKLWAHENKPEIEPTLVYTDR